MDDKGDERKDQRERERGQDQNDGPGVPLAVVEDAMTSKPRPSRPAERPGAIPSGGGPPTGATLPAGVVSQVEQDAMAKARAGAVPSGGAPPAGTTLPAGVVSQVEQDAMAKARAGARPSGGPSGSAFVPPGVVSQVEQDAMAKARAAGRGVPPAAALPPGVMSQVEQDAMAKARAAGRVAPPSGTTPSSEVTPSMRNLARMVEEDALAKARAARPGAAPSTLDPAARKQRASEMTANLGQFAAPVNSPFTSMDAGGNAAVTASGPTKGMAGASALESMRHFDSGAGGKEEQQQAMAAAGVGVGIGVGVDAATSAPTTIQEAPGREAPAIDISQEAAETQVGGDGGDEGHPSMAAAAAVNVQPMDADVYAGLSYDPSTVAGGDTGGIQAFVAPQEEIVEAGVVAPIKTEEELQEEERKKMRKYCCYGLVAATVVIILVVVPTAVLVPKNGTKFVDPRVPSAAPSMAPTLAPSSAPTTNEFQMVLDFLSQNLYSGNPEVLQDRESPQYQSAVWVSEDSLTSSLMLGSPKWLQRYALSVFYFTTGGDSWASCSRNSFVPCDSSRWLSSDDECTKWHGIFSCNSAGDIDRILFQPVASPDIGNNLTGTFPSELALLTSLISFISSWDPVGGSLDAFSGLSTLSVLTLVGNQLTALPGSVLTNNTGLTQIRLGGNRLNGTIPTEIAELSSLVILSLELNSLSGTIPSELGNATSLTTIELSGNQLEGTIPSEMFLLTKLADLRLDGNEMLVGGLSAGFTQMPGLKRLVLGGTQIGGQIPEELFFGLTALTSLSVSNALFNGTLSENFALWNGTMRELLLNNNTFSGTIPSGFGELTQLTNLAVEGNNLEGNAPEVLCSLNSFTLDCGELTCSCCAC